ncbi:lipoprotein NlpI [Aestuariibacter sp. GS-14]|uniref:lipoprotein NlpI n=1 Tax=Aestuariibacter sp. GS-14 TaxID=2590670 RepID=UPI0011267869|nr:lipoprotein NlpI [Aestuariibacter sp. GS-14]TPV61155.1 lipoprotein NlpI [Aestuariibacter sp. GS-14]
MLYRLSAILLVIGLAGCVQTPDTAKQTEMGNLLVPEPAPVSVRSQVAIARFEQILTNAQLTDSDKAQIHFQRGMLYDSVGLSGLAQFDYNRAISFKPDMAEAYNSLGVHLVQQREFSQAYEAFDSTLEIDPDYEFAFLNRGIALYYGGRADLAVQDLATFAAKAPQDPFRALWAYFADREHDPLTSKNLLAERRAALAEQHWATKLVDMFLGTATENQLLDSLLTGVTSEKELTDRLCEAYFYLGKYHEEKQQPGIASNYFKFALSTNVFEYVEHRYARLELERLRKNTVAE